ncbi:NAD-dependent epimerase/dehydratase family protein [Arenibaculum pallidiluteum]|uniref:NAD-dependent epimerase/dehydratase family protein n=1 Tax=Arenibaculum pallidiluteum TaxID=2812559 RepID=UPI001A96D8EC|nr:SDR family NAD(P)-dependent oxidoreductase [Arenibaculum pallidiluteum]
MPKTILITGGAGFIGSHVADELLSQGYRVRALDCLSEQVHGPGRQRPDYLSPDVELMVGDVRDPDTVKKALAGVDAVYHFAAIVGVGQSMFQVDDYVSINDQGTAVLLQAILQNPVEKLLVASSMSVYGEGLYLDAHGHKVTIGERAADRIRRGQWEPASGNGGDLTPVPTPETKTPSLASIYALNKFVQERMCMLIGQAYNIPTVGLRFFNVYGTRQALSNPYTGVLAIFASRLLNDKPPMIFEDGLQRRNFVHVSDVARCCVKALQSDRANGQVFNVSTDEVVTVREVAQKLAELMGKPRLQPEITNKHRVGDIRHCFADISLAQELLDYRPQVSLDEGLEELVDWLRGQVAVDRVDVMRSELTSRGLAV